MTDTTKNLNKAASVAKETAAGKVRQATSRQFILAVFVLSLAAKMFILPIYLIQSTGRDGYIALSIYAAFDMAALVFLLFAMKFSPDTDFFTLSEKTIGKIGTKILVSLIALFLFFKLCIATSETVTFYSDNVFAEFNSAIMLAVFSVFLAAIAVHTLKAVCRLNELLAPVVTIGIVVLFAIVIATGFDFENIFPALRAPGKFRSALFSHAAWVGDFTPLILFIGRTERKKHTTVFAVASGVIGNAVTVFFSIVMCAAFGNVPMLADSTTNMSSVLQYSLGNVYGRIDLFSSVLWSVSAFIETALLFYSTARCVEYVVGRHSHFIIGASLCVVLFLVEVFAMTDPTVFSAVTTDAITSAVTFAFAMGIPIYAFVAAIVRNKKNKKSGDSHENAPANRTAAEGGSCRK